MTGREVTCVRCDRTEPRRGVGWPEGYVCRRCFQRATRIRGACPGCGQQGLLPGLNAVGAPICRSCAGIEHDLSCTRCGEEDERHRRGLCARCCLRDDLTALLDNGSGAVRAELAGLLEAICAQQHPRSALIWLRNADVRRLLTGFATGRLPLTHTTMDAEDSKRAATHLRDLLMRYGALESRDRVVASFEAWLATVLPGYSPAAAALLRKFATWHHLRRMRHLAADGQLRPGTAHTAKQEITAAGQLLTHLETLGAAPAQARQGHIDAWLATGPCTRYHARTFVVWATKAGQLPPLQIPRRRGGTPPVITQDERIRLLRNCFHDTDHPTAYRLAAVLLLLYAQPLTRICRLRLDDIVTDNADTTDHDDGGTWGLRLDQHPVVLPDPVRDLTRQHLASRANTNTAAGADSPWLFPGYRSNQPLHHSYLSKRVRDAGVHLRGARNSALRQLVLDMPPAVAAQALGYSPQVAENHARAAGTTWVTYASYRSRQARAPVLGSDPGKP